MGKVHVKFRKEWHDGPIAEGEGDVKVKPGEPVLVEEARARFLLSINAAELCEGEVLPEKGKPAKKTKKSAPDKPSWREKLPEPPARVRLAFVVPTRNRPGECAENVRRLLDDPASDDLLVFVVDDAGSKRPRLRDDARVTYVRLGDNRGPSRARHAGILLAPEGSVIVELDDHDLVEPGAVRAVSQAFAVPGTWAAYGDCWKVNSKGERVAGASYQDKGDYEPWSFRTAGALQVGMRAYRRPLYFAVGGYRFDEHPAGDYGLMLRMEARLEGNGVAHLARPLCSVVVHCDGISLSRRAEQGRMARKLRYLATVGALFETTAKQYAADAGYHVRPEPPPVPFGDVREELLAGLPNVAGRTVAVVPTWNTRDHLGACLDSLAAEGLAAVVVDDACPKGSSELVLERADPSVALVRLSRNTGFPHAVNAGARIALAAGASRVLLLNADAALRPGCAKIMEEALAEKGVGVVGPTIYRHGVLDSKGSEFRWDSGSYQHVRDLKARPPVERDVVTFGCALVRAVAWRELEGLDERYRKAYWEDADFCVRAREKGWRVVWCAGAEADHACGGSGPDRRDMESYEANRELFDSRWVATGKVDKLRRSRGLRTHRQDVVACMIVCGEEEFVASSLESVLPIADRAVVVVGGTEAGFRAGLCGPDGLPLDRTLEEVRSVEDGGRIELVMPPDGKPWPDKRAMRQAYADRLSSGDWMVLLDGDEVFTEAGLWRLSRHMHSCDVVLPNSWTMWNDFETRGTGTWDNYYTQHKAVRWMPGYNYTSLRDGDNHPADASGRALVSIPGLRILRLRDERLYVHYSWVRPVEKLRRKLAYYQNKPDVVNRPREDYIDRVFLAWRKSPEEVERRYGTHPMGRGGSEPFMLEHPEPVRRRLADGRLGGEGW